MPLWAEHALVITLAIACALVMLVRRLRVLRARASACSTCAYAAVCEKRGEIPAFGEGCVKAEGEGAIVNRRRLPMLRASDKPAV